MSASAIGIAGETHGPTGAKVAYEVPRALDLEEIPGVVASVGYVAPRPGCLARTLPHNTQHRFVTLTCLVAVCV